MKRKHSFFYYLITSIGIWVFVFFSFQVQSKTLCPPPDTIVKINVRNTPARIIYKNNYSQKDLERMQRKRKRHSSRGTWKIAGLTQTDFKYSIKTSAKFKKTSKGRFCAYPVSYELNIGYADFLVYIDRRYRPGSCEYRAILDHENDHVAIYKRYLKRYLPYIKKQVWASALKVRPFVVSTPDSGTKYIQKQLQRHIRPLILKLKREADKSNAHIDTPTSYRQVQLLCDNW